MNHEFWSTPAGEKLTKRIPQRRVGAESDLDRAIMLRASSASRYGTGTVVTVDGGLLRAVGIGFRRRSAKLPQQKFDLRRPLRLECAALDSERNGAKSQFAHRR